MSEDRDWSTLAFDADGLLVDLADQQFVIWEPPAPGRPVPVEELPNVLGRRLVLMRSDGPIYDHRAASEVFTDDQGSWVRVVAESQWYQWSAAPVEDRPPQCPHARVWPTRYVFVEVYAS